MSWNLFCWQRSTEFCGRKSKVNADHYHTNLILIPKLIEVHWCLAVIQDWLHTDCDDFIAKDEWPPNSPDLNQLDYHVWGTTLEAYSYHKLQKKPSTIAELRTILCRRSGTTFLRSQWQRLFRTFTSVCRCVRTTLEDTSNILLDTFNTVSVIVI